MKMTWGFQTTLCSTFTAVFTLGMGIGGPPWEGRACDEFDPPWYPYVVIEPAAKAGCWSYGPNAKRESIRGCMDVGGSEAHLTLSVSSEYWSGTVIFDTPSGAGVPRDAGR